MRRLLWLVICLAVAAATGLSQSSSARFSLTGVVEDPAGASIAGAKVELNIGGITQKSTVTDRTGNFRFTQVQPAKYQIRVTSDGFEPTTVEVIVESQRPAPLRVSMPIANLRTELTVNANTEQISTEAGENKDSASLSGESLSNLPVFDRDYIGTMSRFLDPGSVGNGGVTLIVNGMEVNNLGVSASAIKEIKINQDPYSAEFQRPGRDRIEIITKPGTPEYHGTFNFTFRDSHLNARDPFALIRPPEQRRIFEGVLTGPIGHSKKTSFLFSMNRNDEDLQTVVFAQGPSGIINANVPTPVRNMLIALQINHEFSDNDRISLRYSDLSESTDNQGVGGTVLPEAGIKYRNREQEITYSQELVLSPKLVNNFRILFGVERQSSASLSDARKIVVLDAFTGGGAQADQLRTEVHTQINDVLTYASGKHIIKGGINIPDISRRGLDNNLNSTGTFYFSSLQDYVNGQPFSFRQQQGNGHNIFLQKVFGLFVQDEYHLRKNLMFSVGVRYDWENYYHDDHNISPRFSFAYSPDKGQKTVIRGGAGVFYDRIGPRIVQDVQMFNGTQLRLYVLPNPTYPDPFSNGVPLSTEPVSVTRLAPGLKTPSTFQFSIGVERQLSKSATLTIGYFGSRGFDLFRSRDTNAPQPPLYSARPDASIGVLREIESAGRSRSDSLEIGFRGKINRYFEGMAKYRLAAAYDNTGGVNYFPPNSYDLAGEWGRSDFDRRHRLELLGTINPGKLFNLGVSLSLYSGSPYTLTTGLDQFQTGTANARPAGVSRNSLQGPGYADLDLRWSRDFSLVKGKKKDGGLKGTLAVDAFNILNCVNYSGYIGNQSSPFFGHAIAAQPPRRLQLSFRLRF